MPAPWIPFTAIFTTATALALIWVSYLLAQRDRYLLACSAVAVAGMLFRAYAAIDFELHPWDERYHALVAKHLIDAPFRPVLYADPVMPYDYTDWYSNHIWLHKPPLALWLQAASMSMFGVSEISLRLPSLLISTLSVLITFGIGRILLSQQAGLVAASFQAFNGFLVDLSSGRRASDHVDTLLIFVVEASLLAALVANQRKPRVVPLVLGIGCGLAILTKTLSGALLLPIWIAIRSQDSEKEKRSRIPQEIAAALVVAAVIASPWLLYSMNAFPRESAHESTFAWRHVFEVLETQGGPPWQYLAEMPMYFGELIYIPIAYAVFSAFTSQATAGRKALLLWIAVPYVLFSLMATKMPAYVAIAAPALFLVQAEFWLKVITAYKTERPALKKYALLIAAIVLAVLPARQLLTPQGPLEAKDLFPQWANDLRGLNQLVAEKRAVIFNVPTPIEAMFYTPFVAYRYLPTDADTQALRARGYSVYVFDARSGERPPSVRRLE